MTVDVLVATQRQLGFISEWRLCISNFWDSHLKIKWWWDHLTCKYLYNGNSFISKTYIVKCQAICRHSDGHVGVSYTGLKLNSLAPERPGCHFKTAIFNLVLLIGFFRSSYDNAPRSMPWDLTDDKSTLGQVMAWCRPATSHYLSQCWPSSMSHYGITRPQWVNGLITTTWLTWDILSNDRYLQIGSMLTLYMLQYFEDEETEIHICIFVFLLPLDTEMVAEILPHMEDKYMFRMHIQYHSCWWPGITRIQDINNHGNNIIILA